MALLEIGERQANEMRMTLPPSWKDSDWPSVRTTQSRSAESRRHA